MRTAVMKTTTKRLGKAYVHVREYSDLCLRSY